MFNHEQKITHNYDKNQLTVMVYGPFTAELHRVFVAAYKNCPDTILRVVLDMRHSTYMDSTALGMLVMMREHFSTLKQNVEITITHLNPTLETLFKQVCFNRLFTVK